MSKNTNSIVTGPHMLNFRLYNLFVILTIHNTNMDHGILQIYIKQKDSLYATNNYTKLGQRQVTKYAEQTTSILLMFSK